MNTPLCLGRLLSAIESFDSGRQTERNLTIVKKYLGLDGNGGASMEAAGSDYALTRESVRQILKKYKTHISQQKISFISIRDAIAVLAKQAPISADSASQKLSKKGLIPEGFKVEALPIIAEFFDIESENIYITKEKSFRAEEFTNFVVTNDNQDIPKNIFSQTLRATSHNGAASINHIAESLKNGTRNYTTLVKDIVESIPGLVWLDEAKNWFYISGQSKNRVVSRLHRIFGVFTSATAASTAEAVRRSINKHNYEISRRIPLQILKAICESEGLSTEGEMILKTPKFNGLEVDIEGDSEKRKIASYELKILAVLASRTEETIQEVELENIIVKDPSDKWPYSMALNYSPLIVRIKRGTYRATGIQ